MLPVLTGIPSREQISIPTNAPASLKNESQREGVAVISPIDFIILFPPSKVESDITVPTKVAKMVAVLPEVLAPVPSKNNKMPINFCPSCAPCIKEIEAEENISSLPYGRRFFFNTQNKKEVIAKEITIEKIIYMIMEIVSLSKEEAFPKTQREAPAREKISAWLSLDGILKSQLITPNSTTQINEERHKMLPCLGVGDSAKRKIDFATAGTKRVLTMTPNKLKAPLKRLALKRLSLFDKTTEQIAFGASVQPFTNTTQTARKNAKKSRGVSIFVQKFIIFPHFKRQSV